MTDVWDIAQYIEAHPDNHIQRWRLAKKLYMAWEYRLALEHLQVLKNEWDKKINVSRYLAATYYRLTRYAEAIKELEFAIDAWPEELGLQEQLARTLDVAGRKDEAALVWKNIAKSEPDHPFAKRAVEHLDSLAEAERGSKLSEELAPSPPSARREVPDGAAEPGERECPHCGSKNSPEFQRCWQCHGAMTDDPQTEAPGSVGGTASAREEGPWGLISGIAIVTLLAAGVYQMLGAYNALANPEEGIVIANSLQAFMADTFFWTKIIIAGTALVVWPLVWRVTANFVGVDHVYNEVLYRSGGLLAALAFAFSWLPGSLFTLALIIPAIVSAGLAFRVLKAPPARALAFWLVQGAVIILVGFTVILGRHGLGPVADAAALNAFTSQGGHSTLSQIGQTPLVIDLKWDSSASDWLDAHAATIAISGTFAPHDKRLQVELATDDETLVFHEVKGESFELNYTPIRPGTPYTLRITGQKGIETSITVQGVLKLSADTD